MTENRVFKIKAVHRGGHWHLAFFSAPHAELTFACLGKLVLDEADFHHFTSACDWATLEIVK